MTNYAFLMNKAASGRTSFAVRYGPVDEMKALLLALPAAHRSAHFVAEQGQAYWYAPELTD